MSLTFRSIPGLSSCGIGLLLCIAGPASADWLQTYVATTCDVDSGRALVRFGYGDAHDPAKFIEVSPSIDGGLSKLPMANVDKHESSCEFPEGREIKVRYVFGTADPGSTKGPWSVWVDKIKILHAVEDGEAYPYGVIVEKDTFRVCRFHLADGQWAYDLTSAVQPEDARPTPVECDAKPTSIHGERDWIEYPISGPASKAEPGSIIVERARENELCSKMVKKHSDQDTEATWSVERSLDASSIRDFELPDEGRFQRLQIDLDNGGRSKIVYGLHPSNHANDADIYFMSPGEAVDALGPQLSEEKLWQTSPYVFPFVHGSCGDHKCGAEDLDAYLELEGPTRNTERIRYRFRYLHIEPFIWRRTTYFILNSVDSLSSSDLTVVVKPSQANKLEETCIFRMIQPHL